MEERGSEGPRVGRQWRNGADVSGGRGGRGGQEGSGQEEECDRTIAWCVWLEIW